VCLGCAGLQDAPVSRELFGKTDKIVAIRRKRTDWQLGYVVLNRGQINKGRYDMTQILRLGLAATLTFLIPAAAARGAGGHAEAGAHATTMPPPIVAPLPLTIVPSLPPPPMFGGPVGQSPAPSLQTNSLGDRALSCQQTGSAAGVSPGQLGSFTAQCMGR
jgi:hypothetical protein